MRIGIVGLSIEIMLASPVPTTWDAIQHYTGRDMSEGDVWMVRGMLARMAKESDVEAVPLYWATALPGGPLELAAYQDVKEKTLALISAHGPFDGMLVANHGALEVQGLDIDADTDFIQAIRNVLGPDVPVGVSLDLHGDMTPELLEASTVISVLRTAPHRDDRQTGYRAADQLIRVIRTGITPKKSVVSLPILIPGETAVTALEPAKSLYGSLLEYDSMPGMMEANILVGFAWNDRPWTAVSAIAVSEGDVELARTQATRLAQAIWAKRAEFNLKMETAEVRQGLRLAVECPQRPVFVSDSGDNTTAGAAGDLTLVLQAALDDEQVRDVVVAGITAPETVRKLVQAGVGSTVKIELGTEHLSRPKTARRVSVLVEACGEELVLPGFQPYRSKEGAWAKVRSGNVIATFHANAIGITTPHHFIAMDISPTEHKAYVVKLGYLHPQLEDVSARHILLLSDGTSQLDMTQLQWNLLPRPTYPLEEDFEWDAQARMYGD
ncbi:M81 family metallopeptidase [Mesorhizobium sp. CA13]|uniref:M81 family metallopeptidase n=1 Tax=unclassified Mesorhizobium TaxID=325217 RepID=UPI001125D833|nr:MULTISPECIES: M81 family metallopeptidase [unclassified Mesorhizobium]MBZ9858033.1 M81 family metallopeptidase [Mesorhizobium sp. CA13]MBZ9967932.1 M81 family metallopeptidase [Mesorhizobium sp. BR1-1-2]MCA0016608.1 M81 family metallopeptidase [Mesorhizobium sp. B294B1A1]MCA0040958.1 M81 family metallopeptidase [Mesorhizobium sp. B292B1B]TPM36798.1 M81 family metallopeptidase [Mesorhizobium sp. B2-3-2]